MRTAILALSLAVLAPGCVIYASDSGDWDDDWRDDDVVVVTNAAPQVFDGEAGVYWDPRERDDIWYFDAWVDDLDGLGDITEVWADVYDEADGSYVESFPLYPDPVLADVWTSEYYGSSTFLDPFYSGYTVDLVAIDQLGDEGGLTVWADTY